MELTLTNLHRVNPAQVFSSMAIFAPLQPTAYCCNYRSVLLTENGHECLTQSTSLGGVIMSSLLIAGMKGFPLVWVLLVKPLSSIQERGIKASQQGVPTGS